MKLKSTNSNARPRSMAFYAMAIGLLLSVLPPLAVADETNRQVMVRDITSVEGVRENMLVGYGLVVGLRGTGDRQQTIFTVQTLANAMQKMGVLISPSTVVVKNVAAVFITASLPAFARPGSKLDVTVSSIGDAQSLEGGVLLMSALYGPDGKVYAEAQGSLVLGGYSAGTGANKKDVNAANVGLIPQGAMVERDTSVDLSGFKTVSLLLRNPDFSTAVQIADAVNKEFSKPVASAIDNSRVDISVDAASSQTVTMLISRVQNLVLNVHTPAKIVINERTGTIVMGGDVKLSPVSVIHGNLSIQVVTTYVAVGATPVGGLGQPGVAGSGGDRGGKGGLETLQPIVVPEVNLNANDAAAQSMRLDEGANVDELVKGLHAIGTTAHDVVAILQAIRAEGGMQAELEVQ
ncbi:MAG TPA: flagellar basal body P-ring protein FlgI [Acidobacteriaceae bacterium]|jgi:flagellar P-ring protein precursor FlgI|nr:flagellar basal body P-ring protein FlgI [Acidobacteriaceae bacterium]